MNAQITDQDIMAKAYDLLEDGATYSATDFAALKEQALEALLSEDEGTQLTNAQTARECAMLRDFWSSQPGYLAADYAKHGNAWPFSGDHLGIYEIRDEYYVDGVGWEQGDVIGRERNVERYATRINIWANTGVAA